MASGLGAWNLVHRLSPPNDRIIQGGPYCVDATARLREALVPDVPVEMSLLALDRKAKTQGRLSELRDEGRTGVKGMGTV
jgi:hypothetical protein